MLPITSIIGGHKVQKACDRRTNGGDRWASDHEKALPKPKDDTLRAVIGMIGKFRVQRERLLKRLNNSVQGTGAEGLKLTLLYECRHECPGQYKRHRYPGTNSRTFSLPRA
jgi:hypothetical protein